MGKEMEKEKNMILMVIYYMKVNIQKGKKIMEYKQNLAYLEMYQEKMN